MSHTGSGPEHQQVGGRRREWGKTSCLYPGLFKTQHTRTHTHTTSINPRQPRPCSWERNWPRSTPGYFGKALRTCVSCKRFSLPSALLSKKRSYCPQWEPLEGQRGSRFPGKRREPRNPGVCPQATGRKRGNRGWSPCCVPGMLSVLYPLRSAVGNWKPRLKDGT